MTYKNNMNKKVNKVFEYHLSKDNTIVFSGLKFEICEYLKCLSIELDEAIKKDSTLYGYKISRTLTDRRYLFGKKARENKPIINIIERKVDKRLNYLIRHLNEYGNTCLGCISEARVKEYIDKLDRQGIKAKYRKVKYKFDKRYWYVLEVMQ